MWRKDGCCYLGFSTQSISQCIYSPLSHPPDLSSLQFLHFLYAYANSYSSPDSAQSVLYLTLIKPPLFFFPPPPRKGLSGYSRWSSPHQPFLSELRLFHRQSASLCEESTPAEERAPPN